MRRRSRFVSSRLGYLTESAMSHSDLDTHTTWGRLVLVFVSVRIPEGLLAKGLLESEGIRVFVKGESEGPYRMGPVYLWVPEEEEVQARLVLDSVGAPGAE
jgi:hypothetical protein